MQNPISLFFSRQSLTYLLCGTQIWWIEKAQFFLPSTQVRVQRLYIPVSTDDLQTDNEKFFLVFCQVCICKINLLVNLRCTNNVESMHNFSFSLVSVAKSMHVSNNNPLLTYHFVAVALTREFITFHHFPPNSNFKLRRPDGVISAIGISLSLDPTALLPWATWQSSLKTGRQWSRIHSLQNSEFPVSCSPWNATDMSAAP